MRRSSRLTEKQAKPANEIQTEPRAKKKRSNGRIRNIPTLDNGTMMETFKFLNYCQLAKNSLVSKKFRDLIRGHRHKLALLYVNSLVMTNFRTSPSLTIFGQNLSPEDYKKWVNRNQYLKRIPIYDQLVGEQSAQHDRKAYSLWAYARYENPNSGQSSDITTVLFTHTKLNHKHWPLFQHFVRLLTDPFVYIRFMRLIAQNVVSNLLAGAIDQDRGRLRCEKLTLDLDDNVQKFISWVKYNICCDEIVIVDDVTSNHDQELLDLMMTGAQCTSKITMAYSIRTKVVVDVVQKFMDLKSSSNECRVVESDRGNFEKFDDGITKEVLKRDYAKFLVKEVVDEDDGRAETVFEFVNSDVGKKLQLSVEIFVTEEPFNNPNFAMTVKNV